MIRSSINLSSSKILFISLLLILVFSTFLPVAYAEEEEGEILPESLENVFDVLQLILVIVVFGFTFVLFRFMKGSQWEKGWLAMIAFSTFWVIKEISELLFNASIIEYNVEELMEMGMAISLLITFYLFFTSIRE